MIIIINIIMIIINIMMIIVVDSVIVIIVDNIVIIVVVVVISRVGEMMLLDSARFKRNQHIGRLMDIKVYRNSKGRLVAGIGTRRIHVHGELVKILICVFKWYRFDHHRNSLRLATISCSISLGYFSLFLLLLFFLFSLFSLFLFRSRVCVRFRLALMCCCRCLQ